jgi:hypothetical protein
MNLTHTVVRVLDKNNQPIVVFIVTKNGDVHVETADGEKANIIICGSEVGTK